MDSGTSNGNGHSSSHFIVDKVFSRNRLHIIFGPPRSGRSTLLIQTAWDWSHGEDIFEHKSNPAHFCLVDTTRPLMDTKSHIARLGYDGTLIPTISLLDSMSNEERTIEAAITQSLRLVPMCRVIFLDGLQFLCHGNIIYQRDVSNFMSDIAKQCTKRQLTIIGTAATSKSSESNGQTPILQRITGSTAWAELCGTLAHIAPTNPNDFIKPERTLSISIPNAKPLQLAYSHNEENGRLDHISDAADHPEMDAWLRQIADDAEITSKDIVDAAEERKMSRRTAYRWLQDQLALGTLLQLTRGHYKKSTPPTQ